MANDEPSGATRVTQLELFFDLVFVFVITQLTTLLSASLSWRNLWHVIVALGLIFWMYDGYAWMTNAVPATGAARLRLLLGGMAGYLVLAIAVPNCFGGTGLTFGLAYLVITSIHSFLYISAAGESSSLAMRALAPWNLLAAMIVLVSGAIGGTTQEVCWTAVSLGLWFATRVGGGFEIQPAHFVERHALLVIVAIGEAVVATGVASSHLTVDLTLVTAAVLGLLLSAALWWSYFGGDDGDSERVERALSAARGPDRPKVAFHAFGYAFYVMLLGVVLTAVGLKRAVADAHEQLPTASAFALTAGVAIFLLGVGSFRVILGLRTWRVTDAFAPALLIAVPAATEVSGLCGLAVLVAGLGVLLRLQSGASTQLRRL